MSCCRGVSFKARKAGAGTGDVRFKVGDVQTLPEGGQCESCDNDFGVFLFFTEEWTERSLSFDQLKPPDGWGDRFEALRTDSVYHLQWQVHHPRSPFDIWVDDVRLTQCQPSTTDCRARVTTQHTHPRVHFTPTSDGQKQRAALVLWALGAPTLLASRALAANAVATPTWAWPYAHLEHHLMCLLMDVALSLLMMAFAAAWLWRSDPFAPKLRGAAAGVACGGWVALVMATRCPH